MFGVGNERKMIKAQSEERCNVIAVHWRLTIDVEGKMQVKFMCLK